MLDVARRIAGTGSLGVERYAILVEGKGSPDINRTPISGVPIGASSAAMAREDLVVDVGPRLTAAERPPPTPRH